MTKYHEGGKYPRETALLTARVDTSRAVAISARPTASAMSRVVTMRETLSTNGWFGKSPNGRLREMVDPAIPSRMANRPDYSEIGARLRVIREFFSDMTQLAWAEKHGFSPAQYNNWERGARRISVDEAQRLCQLYGVTLDYIYLGRRDGLSESFRKSL